MLTKNQTEWLNSKDGQKALKEAFNAAEKEVEYLNKVRKIDTESLHRPITILRL